MRTVVTNSNKAFLYPNCVNVFTFLLFSYMLIRFYVAPEYNNCHFFAGLLGDAMQTMGMLDLGGGSTQITFLSLEKVWLIDILIMFMCYG